MPAVVTVGEKTVNLGDVPGSLLAQVAAEQKVPWTQLVDAPLMDLSVALALHRAVAGWAQVDVDVSGFGWQDFLALWTVAVDDLPTEYEDGIPKAEADPTRRAGITAADYSIPEFMREEPLAPHNVTFDVPDSDLDSVFDTL